MASLTVRLPAEQIETLKQRAAVEGVTVSDIARRLIVGPDQLSEASDRLDDHERRLGRLEEMAGL